MTAALCGISAMPTFQFFKNKNKVDEIRGANPVTLENKIKQWIGTSTNTIVSITFKTVEFLVFFTYSLNQFARRSYT